VSDNQAVSWSEYSSHVSEIEYSLRNKISQELLEHIRFLDKTGAPECYTQGVERARMFVVFGGKIKQYEEQVELQEKLF
jgi:hypothetical protein